MPLTEAIKEEDEGHAVELKHDKFLERVIE